jgi:hypothetical protein
MYPKLAQHQHCRQQRMVYHYQSTQVMLLVHDLVQLSRLELFLNHQTILPDGQTK